MKKFLTVLFLFHYSINFSQKIFYPKISKLIEIDSIEVQKFENCKRILKDIERQNLSLNNLNSNEKKQLENCSECKENIYDLLECGCSWYCGGRIDTIITRSNEISNLRNIHDLNYSTSTSLKVNSKFTYKFNLQSSRVTDIVFINGDTRNKKTFTEFSRAKKVKVSYNDKIIGIFELKDEFAEQIFSIYPLGNKTNSKNKNFWTLTFEILESYSGKKDDIAISEIYFHGEHE